MQASDVIQRKWQVVELQEPVFSVSRFPSQISERQQLQSFLHIGVSESKSAPSPAIGSQSSEQGLLLVPTCLSSHAPFLSHQLIHSTWSEEAEKKWRECADTQQWHSEGGRKACVTKESTANREEQMMTMSWRSETSLSPLGR